MIGEAKIIDKKIVKIEKNIFSFHALVEPYLSIDTSKFANSASIVLNATKEGSQQSIKNIIKIELKNEEKKLQNLPFSGDIFLYTNNTVSRTIDLSKIKGNLYDVSVEKTSNPEIKIDPKFEIIQRNFQETKIRAKNIINMTSTKLIELDNDKG